MIKLMKNKIIQYDNISENKNVFEVDSLIPLMGHKVQLEKDFTLTDLFSFIEKDKDLIEKIFSKQMGDFPLDPFIKEVNKAYDSYEGEDEGLDCLEVYWCAESNDIEEFDKNSYQDGLCIQPSFHAIGTVKEKDIEQQTTQYSIMFSPLNSLKNIPIKTNNKFTIYDEEFNIVFENKKFFTLYDFLSAILYEITWSGTPEDRQRKANDLLDVIEDYNKGIKNIISIEDLEKDIE